jgi:hypothetical protein
MFCGKHKYTEEGKDFKLMGRREHTDSVDCSGTWYYQLLGEKIWRLRLDKNNPFWLDQCTNIDLCDNDHQIEIDDKGDIRIYIRCCEGDVIIVNTKLWLHQTEIPLLSVDNEVKEGNEDTLPAPKADIVKDNFSFSYARDFTAPSLHLK